MLQAERLIIATPIFFMTVPAQCKLLIDRCQCLWARKYVLKRQGAAGSFRPRRAMVIAVGGTKSRKMFESIRLTMKYFLDVLDAQYVANLFVNKVDICGAILAHPLAMKEAFRLGAELVAGTGWPDKPVDVELT
jgi:multimeric flavodoxin WrbA